MVLDYGSGNVRSVVRAVERAGVDVELTADPSAVAEADGLVVPGVGAFASCMAGLKAVRGDQLIRRRLSQDQAVLGICVGMQILFSAGFEHGEQAVGVDLWPGTVERLQGPIVPHMGWNTVRAPSDSAMFAGVSAERFYFVHSYGVHKVAESGSDLQVTWTDHGDDSFVAAIEQGPLWATQFHPEKSSDAGRRLLQNWVGTL